MVGRSIAAFKAALVLLICISSPQVWAQVPEDFWGAPAIRSSPSGESMSIEEQQTMLLWTGFYYGSIDGASSNELEDAIRRFQSSLGDNPSGILNRLQSEKLGRRAERAQAQADFQVVRDEWTGVSAMLPMGYLSRPALEKAEKDQTTVAFSAKGSSDFSVKFIRIENFKASSRQVYDYLITKFKKDKKNVKVTGRVKGNYFSISYIRERLAVVRIYQFKNQEARGVLLSYPASRSNIFAPVQVTIFSKLRHFDGNGLNKTERTRRVKAREYPGFEDMPNWIRTMNSNGSGSLVTFEGHVLTNHHVVDGCASLSVNGNDAVLLGVDIVNDLAVLRSDAFARRQPVRFRQNSARLGEDVIVMGYPVFGLSQALNFTTGVVSARTGLQGDRRNIQITAPVQPGNSGGPVLDRHGQQIAVVVAKASSRAQQERNIENMSWVIRGNIAIDFLRDHDVEPLINSGEPDQFLRFEGVADKAKRFTVRVECHVAK